VGVGVGVGVCVCGGGHYITNQIGSNGGRCVGTTYGKAGNVGSTLNSNLCTHNELPQASTPTPTMGSNLQIRVANYSMHHLATL